MLLIFYLSSYPAPETAKAAPIYFSHVKVVHIIEYGVLSLLFYLGLSNTIDAKSSKLAIYSVGLSTLYGITDEIHQLFIPSRSASIYDVITDLSGSSLFIFLLFMVLALKNIAKSRNNAIE